MTTQGGGRRTFAGMRLSRRGLTLLWAVGYGGLALGCLALGEPVFVLAEHRAPMWLDVLPVVVAVAALSAGLRPVAMAGAGVSGFGLAVPRDRVHASRRAARITAYVQQHQAGEPEDVVDRASDAVHPLVEDQGDRAGVALLVAMIRP